MENELNCGRCRKCLYTMVSLRTVGVLDRCPTFAQPLDLDYLANFNFVTLASHWCLVENLEELEKRQSDPDLEAALRETLAGQSIPRELQKFIRTDPETLELRRKVADYEQKIAASEQPLRYQLADKFHSILGKNQTIHRIGERLVHWAWHLFK